MSLRHAMRQDGWALLPLFLVPLLLPVGRTSELGTLIALVAGLALVWQHRSALWQLPSLRLFAGLFACYMLAALVSLPDTVNIGKSWGTFASIWRYLPLGIYACWVLRQPGRSRLLFACMALLVAFWALDAWVQILTGWSLGGPTAELRVTGVFGADNLKLGPVLATLSPFLFAELQRRWGWRGLAAGFVLLLGPVIMAMSRQAWIEFALIGTVFIWQLGRTPQQRAVWLAGAALAGLLVIAGAWWQSDGFAQRMQRTVQMFQGTERGLDHALSGRLFIWGDAVRMVTDHPVNGVGVRGFRFAYPAYAHADDPFIAGQSCGPGEGACHPHHWLLEAAAGTGFVGLLLWLIGIVAAVRAWWRATAAARRRALPATLALAAMWFPLNSHLAFYSAWWGLLCWWLLAVWCAVLLAPEERHEPA